MCFLKYLKLLKDYCSELIKGSNKLLRIVFQLISSHILFIKYMLTNGQNEKSLRLKTCFSTFQSYCGLRQPNIFKNSITTNQLGSKLFQYRHKNNIESRMKRRKLNHERTQIQKSCMTQSSNNQLKRVGTFDIWKLKIHPNQRYCQTEEDCTVVSRKNYKSYLKVKIEKEYNGKINISKRQKQIQVDEKINLNYSAQIQNLINRNLQKRQKNVATTTSLADNKCNKTQQQGNKKGDKFSKNSKTQCVVQQISQQAVKRQLIQPTKSRPQLEGRESQVLGYKNLSNISAWQTYEPKYLK